MHIGPAAQSTRNQNLYIEKCEFLWADRANLGSSAILLKYPFEGGFYDFIGKTSKKLEFLSVSVFRTKIFINTKVRKMLILAIGKNLQWERIELPSLLYLIQIFARNLCGLHLI